MRRRQTYCDQLLVFCATVLGEHITVRLRLCLLGVCDFYKEDIGVFPPARKPFICKYSRRTWPWILVDHTRKLCIYDYVMYAYMTICYAANIHSNDHMTLEVR